MLLITYTPDRAVEFGIEVGDPAEMVERVRSRSLLGAAAEKEKVVAVGVGRLGEVVRVIAVAEYLPDSATWTARPELVVAVGSLGLVVERNRYRRIRLDGSGCGCGCGGEVSAGRDFLPGHDQRALHDRVKRYFGGSTLEAIRRLDQDYGPAEA